MGNEITPATSQLPASRTPWQPPQLARWLEDLLNTEAVWIDGSKLPALTERHLAVVREAVAAYSTMPRGTSGARIDKLMGTAAYAYPAQKITAEEADARLRLYKSELADIHHETLGAAFSAAVRQIKFFPSIAELRALAAKMPSPRRFLIARRLQRLLAAAPEQPIDLVDPAEVNALVRRLSGSMAA